MGKDTFLTISASSEGLFKDKGSRFIALAIKVIDEQAVKEILHNIRNKYHDARHHCYAYRIGYTGENYRSSDDGEPSGTAGRPILGQLLSKNLTNVLIIVVRYFGGTKLGVSGLINAYREAASDAINNTTIVEEIIKDYFSIKFNYEAMNDVMRTLKDYDASIIENNYTDNCIIKFAVRRKLKDNIISKLNTIKLLEIQNIY